MSIRRSLAATAVGVTALLATAGPAFAHVTPTPNEAPASGYATVFFQVPHGCDGSPTTKVAIQIPEGVTSVKPEAVAGWTASTTTTPLATPITVHGKEVTTRVSEVTWVGGPLANDQFQRFGVSMKLPDKPAGSELAFPTVQTCVQGTENWIDIPVKGEPEPDAPAPMLKLTAASGDGHGHSAATDDTGHSASKHSNAETVAWIGVGVGATGLALGLIALIVAVRKKPTPAA